MQGDIRKTKMFHVKHWAQSEFEIIYLLIIHAVDIAQQIPEHATIPIRPARRLAVIRANSLRSDRALGGGN